MNNIFLIAGIVAVIYFIGKFLEMRYVEDEVKPLKTLIKDSLLVYISVVSGIFVIEQLEPVINEIDVPNIQQAFTDDPPF